jgi:hypothetical protein
MFQKDIVRRLLRAFYALPLLAFLLGLARHSYRAKELLVCWLIFCSFFAALALLLLGAVLAWHAALVLVKLSRARKPLAPKPALWLAQLPQEGHSGSRIIAAGARKPPAGPSVALSVPDPRSRLLVKVVAFIQIRVQ